MRILFKSTVKLLSLIFILVNCEQNFGQISLELGNFFNSLFEQIDIYQVVILSTNDNRKKYNPMESLIFQNIIIRHPTKNMNFNDVLMKNSDKFGRIQFLYLNRARILFVSVLETDKLTDKTEQEFLERLRPITSDTFIAKFLLFILHDKTDKKLDYFMKMAWKEELIDLVINEIIIKSNNKLNGNANATTTNADYRKSKGSWNTFYDSTFIGRIHHYNPFLNTYLREPYNTKRLLFPDKLLNLHKYKLRIGVVDYPPYADVKKKADGKLHYRGPGGEMIRCLVSAMNFTIIPEIGSLSQYGILLPNGSATGLLAKVRDNELDAIAFGAFVFYSAFATVLDRTSYISIEKICAVVPLIPLSSFKVNESVLIFFATIISLILAVWIFSLFLGSDRSFIWHPLNIGLAILGMSIPKQPKKLPERFVFGSIVIMSLLYSSNMFAQLTSINLDKTNFQSFSTFEELNESGLIPVLHPNMYNITFRFGEKILQSLGEKAVQRSDYSEICPIWLWEKRNVTCVLGNYMYGFLNRVYVGRSKERSMKLASPCFWSASRAFILRKSSPYTQRFSQIIRRVVESGLVNHVTTLYIFNYTRDQNMSLTVEGKQLEQMLMETSNVEVVLLFCLGTCVSICVFAGEIFSFWLESKPGNAVVTLFV